MALNWVSPSRGAGVEAGAPPQGVPRFQYALMLRGTDVTAALDGFVTRIEYRDNIEGESDQLSVDVEDVDGRWRGPWYPSKGDALALSLGVGAQPLVAMGDFEVDEIQFQGPPSSVSIRALSTGVSGGHRTREGRAFEKTTLRQIAEHIARRRKLTVVGSIREVQIDRVTQYQERDIEFLARLAREYGYVFKVRGKQLVFHALEGLRAQAGLVSLGFADLARYEFTDKIKDVYHKVDMRYHEARAKRTVRREHQADGEASGDTLHLRARSGTPDMAQQRSRAALARANDDKLSGCLNLRGDPRLRAGVSITLVGMGKLDGTWLIRCATHALARGSGYTTRIEIRQTMAAKGDGR